MNLGNASIVISRKQFKRQLPSRLLKEDLIILVVNLAKSPPLAEASLNGEEKKDEVPRKTKESLTFI